MLLEKENDQAVAKAEAFYDESYTAMICNSDSTIRLRRTYLFEPYLNDTHTVLDFGCGPGSLLDTLPAKAKSGVDISPPTRQIAASKGIDVREKLEDFQGQCFDRIISAHALEHVLDPAAKLVAIRNLLAPGGLFILVLPMNEWSDRRQRKWYPNEKNQHLYTWTPLLLGNLLTVCGFEPVEIRTIHACSPPKVGPALLKIHPVLYRAASALASRLIPKRQVLAVSKRG